MRNSKHFCREDHLFKVKGGGGKKKESAYIHSLNLSFLSPLYFFLEQSFLVIIDKNMASLTTTLADPLWSKMGSGCKKDGQDLNILGKLP